MPSSPTIYVVENHQEIIRVQIAIHIQNVLLVLAVVLFEVYYAIEEEFGNLDQHSGTWANIIADSHVLDPLVLAREFTVGELDSLLPEDEDLDIKTG